MTNTPDPIKKVNEFIADWNIPQNVLDEIHDQLAILDECREEPL